jgi:hypothetical protein
MASSGFGSAPFEGDSVRVNAPANLRETLVRVHERLQVRGVVEIQESKSVSREGSGKPIALRGQPPGFQIDGS